MIFGPGEYISQGVEIRGIRSYHDEQRGRLRGLNTIFCFTLDGIRVCHLGDLGHILSRAQLKAIGPVDLLFLPVGGRYTIDALGAKEVMRQLQLAREDLNGEDEVILLTCPEAEGAADR